MATSGQPDDKTDLIDCGDEPVLKLLSPIEGYRDKPLVSLSEALKPVDKLFYKIETKIYVALHNCQTPLDGLTQDESASIHLYTMEFDSGCSLYQKLNQALRAEDRNQLKPWFLFLKLFLTALYKLPPQNKRVWRGIRDVDVSAKYEVEAEFAWWGVSSCTTSINIFNTSDQFLAKSGKRILFAIDCFDGKSIANHSYFKNTEKEIVLLPGSYFKVIGQLNPSEQLYIIQLKQIKPPIEFVPPPFPVIKQEIPNNKWKQQGIVVAGGQCKDSQLGPLEFPCGIFVDDHEVIYITDFMNHRILRWALNENIGQVIVGEKKPGDKINQLNSPRDVIYDKNTDSLFIADSGNKRVVQWSCQNNSARNVILEKIDCYGLAIDSDGFMYVSDSTKNEIRRCKIGDRKGSTLVAGGRKAGDKLNQLNYPTYIFVDKSQSLYIADTGNHRVVKWLKDAKTAILVAGGNDEGGSLSQLSSPYGIWVDQYEQIYIADYGNNRIIQWGKNSNEGTVIIDRNGGLNGPMDLSFDLQRNIYIADYKNNRILKFDIII